MVKSYWTTITPTTRRHKHYPSAAETDHHGGSSGDDGCDDDGNDAVLAQCFYCLQSHPPARLQYRYPLLYTCIHAI